MADDVSLFLELELVEITRRARILSRDRLPLGQKKSFLRLCYLSLAARLSRVHDDPAFRQRFKPESLVVFLRPFLGFRNFLQIGPLLELLGYVEGIFSFVVRLECGKWHVRSPS